MLNVDEALKIIFQSTPQAQIEKVSLDKASGKTLAQKVFATRDQPPFHRVAMDGIGINSTNKTTSYAIEGIQAAGSPQLTLKNNDNCIEVMTGAILPKNCNCVIPYEKVTINNGTATINPTDISDMKNVHQKSTDYKEGEVLLKEGLHIGSAVCAVIASQGKSVVEVYKQPTITIISTGTELVDLDKEIKEHQIFMSNSYAIENELRNYGITNIERKHIVDDQIKTENEIRVSLENSDIVILTGGVSRGKYDFIPDSLNNLGVKKHFHKIEQKPGKPMFYGTKGKKQVFALPGNPVSCLVCLRRYVLPSISNSMNTPEPVRYGILQSEVHFKRAFTYFVGVKAKHTESGELHLTPVTSNGSGDFNSIGQADGFIQLPSGKESFYPGESYKYFSWSK